MFNKEGSSGGRTSSSGSFRPKNGGNRGRGRGGGKGRGGGGGRGGGRSSMFNKEGSSGGRTSSSGSFRPKNGGNRGRGRGGGKGRGGGGGRGGGRSSFSPLNNEGGGRYEVLSKRKRASNSGEFSNRNSVPRGGNVTFSRNSRDGSDSIPKFESETNLIEKEKDESSEEDDEESGEDKIEGLSSSLNGATIENAPTPMPNLSSGEADSYLSQTRFEQCSVSPLSLKGIKDAGYVRMTLVQEATLPIILKGKDVLAKARTGTGKTVAFLLPAIEAIVKSPHVGTGDRNSPIFTLVICPTRELANQAAAEANKLLKYHPTIGVQVVIGGVSLSMEQKRLKTKPCQILIATPGRLKDHTQNTAGVATRLRGVKVLVLDEADQLLDMGFRKDIERIISSVPKERQTLLFSATVSAEVRQICHVALKKDHEYINVVEEGSQETHSQVRQTHLVAPLNQHFPLVYNLLKDHIDDDADYKVLVFCTTAMVTKLVAELLSELKLNVREIHSRKSQSYRTKVSDEFRRSKGLILVTSDVAARGVDYPDVSLVIQVGLPSDRAQYIHRLGRTGRKGKEGQGILLLAPWEEFFLSNLRDLPISKASIPSVQLDSKKRVEKAMSNIDMKSKESAYQAWLGFYNSVKKIGNDKSKLVKLANEFSQTMGLDTPPAISRLIVGKMGLRNVPGLNVK